MQERKKLNCNWQLKEPLLVCLLPIWLIFPIHFRLTQILCGALGLWPGECCLQGVHNSIYNNLQREPGTPSTTDRLSLNRNQRVLSLAVSLFSMWKKKSHKTGSERGSHPLWFPGQTQCIYTEFDFSSCCCSSHADMCKEHLVHSKEVHSAHFPPPTLSILETTKGFLTNAILASVFRARNSCTSSLFAISGTAHNCCKERGF